AWSALTATLVPLGLVGLQLLCVEAPFLTAAFPVNLYGIVAVTTAAWVLVTLLTRPTDPATLDAFYTRVRPAGPGWRRVAASHPEVRPTEALGRQALRWALGVALVYAALFGTGWLLFGRWLAGGVALLLAAGLLAFLVRSLDRTESPSLPERPRLGDSEAEGAGADSVQPSPCQNPSPSGG